MKKLIFGLTAGIIMGVSIPVIAEQIFVANYKITLNGESFETDSPVINYENHTYLPVADILDGLNIGYSWNDNTRTLNINRSDEKDITGNEIFADRLKTAETADKLLIVTEKENRRANFYAYEKIQGTPYFSEVMNIKNCYVGRSGVSDTPKEGEEKTPAGVYDLGRAFGSAADPGSLKEYTKTTNSDYWVDDPDSKYYNMWVNGNISDRDWKSAEKLVSPSEYKYALVINYNTENIIKGAGSAFFIHCSAGKPTAGCVSVPEADMINILKFADDNTKLIIADSVDSLYEKY